RAVDAATDRRGDRADRRADLRLEILPSTAELVGERRLVERLQHAVAPAMRLDVHPRAREGADLVPAHDQIVGVAGLELAVPLDVERLGELGEEALDVEPARVL